MIIDIEMHGRQSWASSYNIPKPIENDYILVKNDTRIAPQRVYTPMIKQNFIFEENTDELEFLLEERIPTAETAWGNPRKKL